MRSSRTSPAPSRATPPQINQLINSGATVSSTVQALDSQVGQIIGNLNQVLTALASRSGDIDSLVTNLQTVSSASASKNSLARRRRRQPVLVATDLAGLIGNNHDTITSTIDNLQTVAADVQNNQQNLANSLSTPGCGPGAVHPDLPVGAMVRRRNRLHLPGQPVGLSLLSARQSAGRFRSLRQPATPGAALERHHAGACRALRASLELVECPSGSASAATRLAASSLGVNLQAVSGATSGGVEVKAVTERNPKVVGIVGVVVMSRLRPGHPPSQSKLLQLGLHHSGARSPTPPASPRARK